MMEANLLHVNAFSKYTIHNFGVKLRFQCIFTHLTGSPTAYILFMVGESARQAVAIATNTLSCFEGRCGVLCDS